MALQRQIQDLDNQINQTVNSAPAAREAAAAKLRQDRGYDQQLKTVNDLKKSALDTEKMISNLPADVKRRTAGRLVTSSQANRITAAEQAPLAKAYGETTSGLGIQQEGLAQTQSEIDRQNQQSQSDLQMKLAAMEGTRGSLFQQMQLQEQQAARSQAAAQAKAQQDAQMRALEAAQRQEQMQGLKGAAPLRVAGVSKNQTDRNPLEQAIGGLGIALGNKDTFSNEGDVNDPKELAYLQNGYKQQANQALANAKQYLAMNKVDSSKLTPQQIREKARELGLGY